MLYLKTVDRRRFLRFLDNCRKHIRNKIIPRQTLCFEFRLIIPFHIPGLRGDAVAASGWAGVDTSSTNAEGRATTRPWIHEPNTRLLSRVGPLSFQSDKRWFPDVLKEETLLAPPSCTRIPCDMRCFAAKLLFTHA